MKLYRLTIQGRNPLDQIIAFETVLGRAVKELERSRKLPSVNAARIERTSVVPDKTIFLKALNHYELGLQYELVTDWDRARDGNGER